MIADEFAQRSQVRQNHECELMLLYCGLVVPKVFQFAGRGVGLQGFEEFLSPLVAVIPAFVDQGFALGAPYWVMAGLVIGFAPMGDLLPRKPCPFSCPCYAACPLGDVRHRTQLQ